MLLSKNDLKKSTKELILEASLRLFSLKGYKSTTVRDIAKDVGITQSGLYNHFKNKEAIMDTHIDNLMNSAIVKIFENKEINDLSKTGKSLLFSIATTFKLISFDKQNEAIFKLLMQELYKNDRIRDTYNEYFYQRNIKNLSAVFFIMMKEDKIKRSDPLLLANEFFAPLFFYQMQVHLLKIDNKSTSSLVTMFEKHVDYFWNNIKMTKQERLF
jgi:AcrR family transcriptional regulator